MKKKILIIGIIVAIIVAIVCLMIIPKKEKAKGALSNELLTTNNLLVNIDNEGVPTHISGKYSEVLVTDEETALKSLEDVKQMMKIKDITNEFYLKNKIVSSGVTYFELQQKYDEIDVLGGELTISVDDKGNVLGINGNYVPEISTSIYAIKSENQVKEIISEKYGENIRYISFEKKVYVGEDEFVSYVVNFSNDIGIYEVIVNAKEGLIISENILVSNYQYTGPGTNDIEYTITLDETNDIILGKRYEFYDEERNIIVTDARGMNPKNIVNILVSTVTSPGTPLSAGMENGKLTYSSNNEPAQEFVKTAVTTMSHLEDIYDYYKEVLNRDSYDNDGGKIIANLGVDQLNLFNDGYQNASWLSFNNQIYIGAVDETGISFGIAKDALAHEFTHGVVKYTADFKNSCDINPLEPNYAGALNEAYADILGALIEGENWIIGEELGDIGRDLVDPEKNEYASEVGGDYYYPALQNNQTVEKFLQENGYTALTDVDNGGVHYNSTVISHAAYLMYNNNAFKDKDEMANVWYNSLFLLSSYANFEDCAYAVIQSATNLGISEEKIEIIKKAFYDTKVLKKDYNLSGNVQDKESDKALGQVSVVVVSKLNNYVNYRAYTDTKGNYSFTGLPAGEYEIIFEKAKYLTEEKELVLNKDEKNNVSLKKINEANYDNSEVVFVMDISSSMNDNDPTEIRKQIIVNILGSMDDKSKAALVTFAKNGETVSDGLSEQEIDKKIIMTDVFNISNVDGFSSNAGTNGKAGLEEALKLFDENSKTRKYIVFLTDGQDTVYSYDVTYEQLIEKAKDNDIRIFTIGLSEKVDDEYLKKIADETDGKYYHADSSTNLYDFDAQIFAEIE